MLGEYSDAMFKGDTEAVYEFWAPEFHSHVTQRVAPDRVGQDVRGSEQEWWSEVQVGLPRLRVQRQPPDRVRRPGGVELVGDRNPHRNGVLRCPTLGRAGRDQRDGHPAHPRRQDRRALGWPALPDGPRADSLSARLTSLSDCWGFHLFGRKPHRAKIALCVLGFGSPRVSATVGGRFRKRPRPIEPVTLASLREVRNRRSSTSIAPSRHRPAMRSVS